MKSEPESLPDLAYPVLKWEPRQITLSYTPSKMCAKSHSGFPENAQHARAGRTRLFDAEGRFFKVSSYIAVKPFGSVMDVLLASLLKEAMYIPVLMEPQQLSLPEFTRRLSLAVKDHHLDGFEEQNAMEISLKKIVSANSYGEALQAVPSLPKWLL